MCEGDTRSGRGLHETARLPGTVLTRADKKELAELLRGRVRELKELGTDPALDEQIARLQRYIARLDPKEDQTP